MCVLTDGGGWTQTEGGELVREALQLVTNPVFLETCIRCLCMHATECPSTPQLWGEAFIQVNTWWCTHSSQGVWSSTWCPVCLLAPVIRDHITCNAASASPYTWQVLEWIAMVSCWLEIRKWQCMCILHWMSVPELSKAGGIKGRGIVGWIAHCRVSVLCASLYSSTFLPLHESSNTEGRGLTSMTSSVTLPTAFQATSYFPFVLQKLGSGHSTWNLSISSESHSELHW